MSKKKGRKRKGVDKKWNTAQNKWDTSDKIEILSDKVIIIVDEESVGEDQIELINVDNIDETTSSTEDEARYTTYD